MASLLLASPPPAQSHRVSFTQSLSASSGLVSMSVRPTKTATSSPLPPFLVYCGRGDKKTAKGKRFNHSFGNARPRSKSHGRGPPRVPVPGAAVPKKDPFEDTEVINLDISDESLLPN